MPGGWDDLLQDDICRRRMTTFSSCWMAGHTLIASCSPAVCGPEQNKDWGIRVFSVGMCMFLSFSLQCVQLFTLGHFKWAFAILFSRLVHGCAMPNVHRE